MNRPVVKLLVVATLGASALMASSGATAGTPTDAGRADDVATYWTPQRIAAAQPRDLVIDSRGLGYERRADGSLNPYGHSTPARLEQLASTNRAPTAKPGGGGNDQAPPTVTMTAPGVGAVITASTADPVSFRTTVSDASGIRSVAIVVHVPGGSTQSFSASSLGNDVWGTDLSGFTPSPDWSWHVVAKDTASRGGNTTTTSPSGFEIVLSGDPGPGGDPEPGPVTNSRWTQGGDIQEAAGRILFEMPTVKGRRTTWNAYVCSGTAVTDSHTNASIILTAAHCVYDDVAKQFARNVLFIPSQDDGGSDGTDSNCSNDPIGCWSPTNGVVDANWSTRKFPANVEWDYGYYVVPDSGAHSGSSASSPSLEAAVNELAIGFNAGTAGDVTHALGYSYSDDPNFMYCAEPMKIETQNVNWWLPNCGLSGGSSGGPWVQPMDTGDGPIISVNSWGYTGQPGMAGPYLDASALCTFGAANGAPFTQNSSRGVIATCP
jgi:hypothetical protein